MPAHRAMSFAAGPAIGDDCGDRLLLGAPQPVAQVIL